MQFFLKCFLSFFLSLAALQLTAQQVITDFLVPQDNRGSHLGVDFSERLTDYDIYEVSRQELRELSHQRADRMQLEWRYQGETIVLELERVALFDHDFRINTGSHTEPRQIDADYGVHYRGQIMGRSGSLVALSLFDNDLVGVINDDELGLINLGVLREYAAAKSLRLIAYPERAQLDPLSFDCHTPDDTTDEVEIPNVTSIVPNTFCFSSYLECDFALYEEQGSNVNNVISFITGAFNAVAMLYDNEDIEATISEIFVWTEPDGYSTNNSEDALDDFTGAMSGGFNGDLAHLISRNPNNLGGRAWINVICSTNDGLKTAYSNINSTYNDFPQYSWTVNVLTHEVGHNLGSRHTHACVWNGNNTQIDDCGNVWADNNGDTPDGEDCFDTNNPILPDNGGTIMSYCHLVSGVGMNFNEGFGLQPGDLIRNRISNCSNCGSADPPINDNCLNATVLSCGETVTGNTELANSDDQPGSCSGLDLDSAPGVWFLYPGDGATVTAALCASSFDTRLAVLSGNCDELVCVQADDNSCEGGVNATVTFTTIPGQDYYLYLTGTAGASGPYSLLTTCEFPTPDNDLCGDAQTITCGETIVATTELATNQGAPADCGTELDAGPGLWYVFAGTGEEITLTTCNAATDFDTKLGVFRGVCNDLTCVIGDDDDISCGLSDLNTTVTFNTAAGENYYIYVTGFGNDTGTFALSASCVSACFPPTGLAVAEQGYAFARLSWAPATTADAYQLRYRQQGTQSWESLPFTSNLTQLIGNLIPCTTYETQVRSDCAGEITDFSESTFLTTDGCDDDYCYSYGDSFGQWISEVTFSNLTNTSGNGYGYTNFTNLTANVEANQSYTLSLAAETGTILAEVFWTVWIDFNQDAIFTADEAVVTNLSAMSNQETNAMVAIPGSAATGTTRMRVSVSTTMNDDPCASGGERDVEDYGIVIGGMETELSVTPEVLNFTTAGGIQEVTVNSNVDWLAEETEDWFSISPASGSGNGSIEVTCEPNPTTMARSGTITISGGGQMRTVTVNQEGTTVLEATPEMIFFVAPGDSDEVTIVSNITWTATTAATWLTISPQGGNGDGVISVDCDPNLSTDPRTTTITVTGGGITRTVTVEQAGVPIVLTVSPAFVYFDPPGGSDEVTLESNSSWTVTNPASWVTISPMSGTGDALLSIDCDEYLEPLTREVTITVTSNGVTAIFIVEQLGTSVFCQDTEMLIDTTICQGDGVMVGEDNYTMSGFYTVPLESVEGCDSLIFLDLTVNNPADLLPTELTTCPGEAAVLNAPAGHLIGVDGTATQTQLSLLVGTYTVSIIDQTLGCTAEQEVTVFNEGGLALFINGETTLCGNESITLTATPATSYIWDTGATTSSITVSTPGTYCLTATDENGCEGNTCIEISTDTEGPQILNCPNDITMTVAVGETAAVVEWPGLQVADNCGSDQVDINGNFSSGDSFPLGSTEVVYTAVDANGNTVNCTFTVNVETPTTGGPLTFYIDTDGYTRSGDTICVPVRVLNFTDVAAFQFSLAAPDELQTSLVNIVPIAPLMGIDGAGGLLYQAEGPNAGQLLWLNPTGDGLTVPDSAAVFQIKLFVDAPAGECVPLALTGAPLAPEAFVVGEGSVIPDLLGGDVCVNNFIDIVGETYKITNEPINLTEVSLISADTTLMDVTDVAGRYDFEQVLAATDYTILPVRDFNDVDGLSVLDMIGILRHIQGRTIITNPYILLAADVNLTGSITIADILEVRELILNNVPAFPNTTSWFFVPVAYEFPDTLNPWLEPVPDRVDLIAPTDDQDIDFYGVKTGDINLTNDGQNLTTGTLDLAFAEQEFSVGATIDVPVYAENLTAISGFQLGLQIDPAYLEILGVLPGATALDAGALTFGTYHREQGELPIIFLREQAESENTNDGGPLFTLRLTARQAGRLSDALQVDNRVLSQQAFDDNLQAYAIELTATELTNTLEPQQAVARLVQVQPNPFRGQFQLDFYLPQSTDLRVELLDVQGRVHHRATLRTSTGTNTVTITPEQSLSNGLYLCRWQTADASGVVKVVKE